MLFLVTTLHKLGPKTLYHSYSRLTIDVEKDFYTEENSVKCKKKGRELLISVDIQLHNAQFLEFTEEKKRSTVPYRFIVRRPGLIKFVSDPARILLTLYCLFYSDQSLDRGGKTKITLLELRGQI